MSATINFFYSLDTSKICLIRVIHVSYACRCPIRRVNSVSELHRFVLNFCTIFFIANRGWFYILQDIDFFYLNLVLVWFYTVCGFQLITWFQFFSKLVISTGVQYNHTERVITNMWVYAKVNFVYLFREKIYHKQYTTNAHNKIQ